MVSVDARSHTFALGSQNYSDARLGSDSPRVPGAGLRLLLKTETDAGDRWQVSAERSSDSTPQDRDGVGPDSPVSALLPANRFVVDGVTADASAAQVSGSLKVGARVSVRAGPLVVIQVQVDSDDEARSFEVNGSLDTAARRFVLRGMPVSYSRADPVFETGNAAKRVGYTRKLKVEGRLSADRALLDAQRIRFDDRNPR